VSKRKEHQVDARDAFTRMQDALTSPPHSHPSVQTQPSLLCSLGPQLPSIVTYSYHPSTQPPTTTMSSPPIPFPALTPISSHEARWQAQLCDICNDPFNDGIHRELHTRCDHKFGFKCLWRWTNSLSGMQSPRDSRSRILTSSPDTAQTCPVCATVL
jgi:hypothetical protein